MLLCPTNSPNLKLSKWLEWKTASWNHQMTVFDLILSASALRLKLHNIREALLTFFELVSYFEKATRAVKKTTVKQKNVCLSTSVHYIFKKRKTLKKSTALTVFQWLVLSNQMFDHEVTQKRLCTIKNTQGSICVSATSPGSTPSTHRCLPTSPQDSGKLLVYSRGHSPAVERQLQLTR